MARRITLKDVAAHVGVSYQTVSKVLNGQATVAEETAAAIHRAVAELGYRTNVTARNLRKQASHLIGYSWEPSAPGHANPILDQFLTSTVEAAEAAGYHLLLFPLPCRCGPGGSLPRPHPHRPSRWLHCDQHQL